MIAWLLLAAFSAEQVASVDVAAQDSPPGNLKIILSKPLAQKCDAQTSDEIVVCAEKTDNESQRLRPIANAAIYEKNESAAEFGISENVRMSFEAGSAELGGGVISKRIMARVKIEF